MSNVVKFPRDKKGSPPQTIEEVHDNLEVVRHVHVEETMSLLTDVIFDNLGLTGFNFTPEDDFYIKDVALAFEALTSMLYKYHRIDYPMQAIAEKIFTLQDDGTVLFSKETDNETTEEEA